MIHNVSYTRNHYMWENTVDMRRRRDAVGQSGGRLSE